MMDFVLDTFRGWNKHWLTATYKWGWVSLRWDNLVNIQYIWLKWSLCYAVLQCLFKSWHFAVLQYLFFRRLHSLYVELPFVIFLVILPCGLFPFEITSQTCATYKKMWHVDHWCWLGCHKRIYCETAAWVETAPALGRLVGKPAGKQLSLPASNSDMPLLHGLGCPVFTSWN